VKVSVVPHSYLTPVLNALNLSIPISVLGYWKTHRQTSKAQNLMHQPTAYRQFITMARIHYFTRNLECETEWQNHRMAGVGRNLCTPILFPLPQAQARNEVKTTQTTYSLKKLLFLGLLDGTVLCLACDNQNTGMW